MNSASSDPDHDETMPINLRFDRALPYYIPANADSGFASSSISRESSFSSTEQDATALSRNSSFSSSSAGSTIDTDSSVSRSSSRRSNEDESVKEQRRRLRATRAKNKRAHCTLSTNQENESTAKPATQVRPSLLVQGRSSSAGSETQRISPNSRLSAPEALFISTPPGRSFMQQYRARSRSWNYDSTAADAGAPKTNDPERDSGVKTEERNKTGSKECLPWLQRGCSAPQRTQTFSTDNGAQLKQATEINLAPILPVKAEQGAAREADKQLQQAEALKKERDELRRERDRFKCERDAIELERDALLRDKEELKKELENRSSIIRHMKDHMKTIPVTSEELRPKLKQRSRSEIKRPGFFPEESSATNINAYTCL